MFARKTGTVESLNLPDINSRTECDWHVKPGDQTVASSSMLNTIGCLRLYNDNYQVMKDDFLKLRDFDAVTVI